MEQIIRELQSLSTDGIAPSAAEHRYLHRRATLAFGSWHKAVITAGLRSRTSIRRQKVERKSDFYMERFLIALHLAEKKGLKGTSVIEGCLGAARNGVLDNYKVI